MFCMAVSIGNLESGYHTHLRTQDRQKGKWNNAVLFVFFYHLDRERFCMLELHK